jgi:pyruvyltransferase
VASINAFWWVPLRRVEFARPELEQSIKGWLRLRAQGGRFMRNFGDELTPLILERLTGRRVKWSEPAKADIVAVGSVLELCLNKGYSGAVWGSGCRHDHLTDDSSWRNGGTPTFLAVRGRRTAHVLSQVVSRDPVLGDPGSLIPWLTTPRKQRGRHGIFIPHFRTWNSRNGLQMIALARQRGIQIVAPNLSADSVAQEVYGAAFVLSSSLHGLVLAHALERPAMWVDISVDADAEPDFKFIDYGSSMNVNLTPLNVRSLLTSSSLQEHINSAESQVGALSTRSSEMARNLHGVLTGWL